MLTEIVGILVSGGVLSLVASVLPARCADELASALLTPWDGAPVFVRAFGAYGSISLLQIAYRTSDAEEEKLSLRITEALCVSTVSAPPKRRASVPVRNLSYVSGRASAPPRTWSHYNGVVRGVARELKVAARPGDGSDALVARPRNMSRRIVSHDRSNSHH